MTIFVMIECVMLNEKIEYRRKELGIKTFQLAHQLQIDASLMSRILRGKRTPTEHQLIKLSEILSMDYSELLQEHLTQRINTILYPYPEIAEGVLNQVAEERVEYLSSPKRFETINTKPLEKDLTKIDQLQKLWGIQKPLNPLQLNKMAEYFNTQYTYESNQIEGNTLDFQETHLVVNEGITIGGKSMQEHLEAINHQEAIGFIVDLVKREIDFNESNLKQLHQIILRGIHQDQAGVYRTVPVRISGSQHTPPEPYMIDGLMHDYFLFYNRKKKILHPIILAAEMHERLVTIHPFIDGNGRTSRLVMNLILMRNGFPIVSLKGDIPNRQRYYTALESVQVSHESEQFYRLIIERVRASLEEHLKLV